MRKFFNNFKKSCKRFMTGKSGFSLVELIVVIAIMAVMAAVLAPALLGYVEKSRMQKDDSAMDEVVNAIQLSLADQSIYDEVLEHSVWDNVSCYIDKKDESQFADYKVQLKAANGDKKEQYMFGDEARLLDETVYYAAGNMRGLTITWSPNESGDTYDFSKGILNKFVGRKTGYLSENPELYNRLRSVIGDKLDTTSQTYRNSDYTIFIRVGSTGGSEAVMQDAIQVWGQFNGTNLAEKDHKFELSSGRVVGTAGANDATTNEQQQDKDDNVVFGENYIEPDWEVKTWNGLTSFNGGSVWTDGTNIYHSKVLQSTYVLNGDIWEKKTWTWSKSIKNFCADYVWSDGTNTYCTRNSKHFVLNGDTWEQKTWNGLTSFDANYIWTDGINTYYSYEHRDSEGHILFYDNYILKGDTWGQKTWKGLTEFYGNCVWTDGTNTYYSKGTEQYILKGDTWEPKIWNGLTEFYSGYVWTDGTNIYYSEGTEQYILKGDTWEPKIWNGLTTIFGSCIWTDGTNIYHSKGSEHYILNK